MRPSHAQVPQALLHLCVPANTARVAGNGPAGARGLLLPQAALPHLGW